MKEITKDERNSMLSSTVSVQTYLKWEAEGENKKEEIIKFIEDRFLERFISPLEDKQTKHGFSMMAVNCLMIESLESFWRGWKKSPNSEQAFCSFFDRSDNLKVFIGHVGDFYKHVRCGIFHQAETTNGWHIIRSGDLFVPDTKTINATKFQTAMSNCLETYCAALRNAHWDTDIWVKFRRKMNAIIKNWQNGFGG